MWSRIARVRGLLLPHEQLTELLGKAAEAEGAGRGRHRQAARPRCGLHRAALHASLKRERDVAMGARDA